MTILKLLCACLFVVCAVPVAQARDLGVVENVTATLEQRQVDGRLRDILILRPTVPTTPEGELQPALLLLEYLHGTPVDMADLTEAATLVRDHGITVLLPSSSNGRWNFGSAAFAGVIDDVSFLDQVIDDALRRFPIDPRRIYMGGYSNGAQMTQRYICDRTGRIAAGAVIAGSIHNADRRRCRPSLPTPMLVIHGTDDGQINYAGNLTYTSSPATASRRRRPLATMARIRAGAAIAS